MHEELKAEVLFIARLIWERRLSDNAGGNISIRKNNVICITPKLMGYRFHWQIIEEHLSLVNLEGRVMEGPSEISREGSLHLGLYREFSNAGTVIHAHPYWTNVFAARAKPVYPTLEYTKKFGPIPCIENVKGASKEMADKVIANFISRREQWSQSALEVIVPRHGVIAMGKNVNECFDILDRIESECRCQILGRLLEM
jgi:L-fuculose-phosphate aldolase